MAYQILPNRSSAEDKQSLSDSEYEDDSEYMRRAQPSQRSRFRKILRVSTQAYALLSTTLLCVLLFLNILHWREQGENISKTPVRQLGEIESTLRGDPRYMTLDHNYDYLWSQFHPEAQIMLKDDVVEEQDVIPGAFSM
jgi:hypothetical protein